MCELNSGHLVRCNYAEEIITKIDNSKRKEEKRRLTEIVRTHTLSVLGFLVG